MLSPSPKFPSQDLEFPNQDMGHMSRSAFDERVPEMPKIPSEDSKSKQNSEDSNRMPVNTVPRFNGNRLDDAKSIKTILEAKNEIDSGESLLEAQKYDYEEIEQNGPKLGSEGI